jgi:Ca2+-binding RTX toxin-like protein
LGNDTLTGGVGQDTFQLTTVSKDTITDFSIADDTIQLENTVFSKLTSTGVLNASNFVVGAAAVDSNDYVIYNSATGALFYDADGSGTGVAVQIAVIGATNHPILTNADFVVI